MPAQQLNRQLIEESKLRCEKWGLDPTIIPDPIEISQEQLHQIQRENKEVLKVVEFFIPEFLKMVKGTPLLIVVTDHQGIITYIEGDNTIKDVIQQLGFRPGVQFTENYNGTNCISLALNHNLPVEVVGSQHYHNFLCQSACYSVPFKDHRTNGTLGTVSIMTALNFEDPLLLSLLSIVGTSIEREIQLQEQNKDLNVLNQVLTESSHTAMILTDQYGRIMEFNPYAEKLTGLKRKDVLKKPASELAILDDWIEKIIQTKESFSDVEVKFQKPNAVKETICLFDGRPIYSVNQYFIGTVCSFRDITERYENQLLMQHHAHHDDLTTLPNRRYFHNYVNGILNSAKGKDISLAVFLLDLDRFKLINDTLGHAKGDTLLVEIAQRLNDYLLEKGKLFRMGGDEFTIALADFNSLEEVKKMADDIIEVVRKPFFLQNLEFHVSTSIGIALYPNDGTDINTLFLHADTAMYRAKDQGKNGYCIYNSDMNEESLKKLTLESELELAIKNNDLMLHYQPQIDLHTNQVVGVEALLRWNHPELGLIPPADFIPLAEEMGLMVHLGEWVLNHGCRQMKKWHDQGLTTLKLSINLSPQEFLKQRLVDKVKQVLQETGLAPHGLELEITESMTMDVVRSTSILEELHELGIQIAIDDFGTGFSSLNYLKNFHIHRLKIDRSFVRDMMNGPKDAQIVSTIISIAHALNLKVIAEGVETEEQLHFLENLKCDEIQGYYYSKPLSASDLEKKYEFNSSRGVIHP
ncbi:EAL domain-containing protein [Paenisporosarcina quisquiliarum]|uniref:EAL domain-containing protein n=1 Tax=Paenisporosarcina quisquiliarum TaxID=365346 RepID=A0A9X3RD06_9BACL|nr:EAL domain-containing protein [Paenisporosarcina quisquiliarum]MCZ8537345.1 EAL domain-containing protein [Paenisporosarcina quisquiliarum]